MLLCMRTTLDIGDPLFVQAKKRAADEGVPLRQVVEAALRSYLNRSQSRRKYRLRWKGSRGRLLPAIDLDDRNSLIDAMDGRK